MRKIVVASLTAGVLFSWAAWAQNKVERITDGPLVKQTTDNSAEIAWSTDAPGSSVVKYGTNPNALTQTAEKPWGGTHEPNGDFNHTVWVKNLRPNNTYYFVVETGQGRGTGTGAISQTQQFHTR
jgi:purple acid phosphatase-like protein